MGRRKTPTTVMSSFTVKPPFPSVTHRLTVLGPRFLMMGWGCCCGHCLSPEPTLLVAIYFLEAEEQAQVVPRACYEEGEKRDEVGECVLEMMVWRAAGRAADGEVAVSVEEVGDDFFHLVGKRKLLK